MRTAVVVVPRERFTSLPVSLRSLFATIPAEAHVVVVEGATPPETRAELASLARERPFDHVSLPYMVKPNEARNIGVARTASELVVIADNDIEYEPGWFEALEDHAITHEADAVAPLICIGPPAATTIHHAGGTLVATRLEDGLRLGEAHRLMDVPLADVQELPEVANQVCEFHCMLARRSFLDELGGLDERLITREQLDFAMRALVLGAKVTFAEKAVVTYLARDDFDPVDLRYHLFRWADRFVVESLDAFEETWGVKLDRDMYRYSWAAKHRARAAETTHPRLRRLLGKDRFRRWVVARAEREVVREQLSLRSGLTPQRSTTAEPRRRRAFARRPRRRDRRRSRPVNSATKLPRVAGMATMPSRTATAPIAIASILPQVDRLWLFLDRFDHTPPYADDERVRVLRSQDLGDLRANGKLLPVALEHAPCTFFAVDDDVMYPADYCVTLEAHLARCRGTAVVGVHAGVLRPPLTSYGRDLKVFHRRAVQRRSEGVDLLGSDSLAFRTSTLRFDVREWPHVNMVDLGFARIARERSVPLVKVPRPAHWLGALDENQEDSIWTGVLADDSRQTLLAQELVALPRPRLPRRRLRRLSYRSV